MTLVTDNNLIGNLSENSITQIQQLLVKRYILHERRCEICTQVSMSLRDEVSYTDPYSSYDSSCCQIGQGTLYGGGGRGTED